MARVFFVIARQPALLDQPAEAALDHPAPRQDHEAFLFLQLADEAQPKAGPVPEEPPHVPHEFLQFPGIPAIGADHQQTQEAVAKHAEGI